MTQEQQDVLGVPLTELVGLLDLEQAGEDHYRGHHTTMSAQTRHVFGGLVAAQALVAAGRTVAVDRTPHSLHSYFLRPGDHRLPLELHVSRTRDGGSLSHRRISVEQDGAVIAELSGSFARPSRGPEHAAPAPSTTSWEAITADHEALAEREDVHPAAKRIDAFELRTVGLADPMAETTDTRENERRVWLRASTEDALGDDPLLHAALLAYATDLRIMQPILRTHGIAQMQVRDRAVANATIDHTVWFHEPVRVDQWLLMASDSPWAGHGRGLARASIFDQAGALVASATQEAMVRYLS